MKRFPGRHLNCANIRDRASSRLVGPRGIALLALTMISGCAMARHKLSARQSDANSSIIVALDRTAMQEIALSALAPAYSTVHIAALTNPAGAKEAVHLAVQSAIETLPPVKEVYTADDASRRGVRLTWPYHADSAYQIRVSAGSIADLILDRRERVLTIGGGDTMRWLVTSVPMTSAGSSIAAPHILIKPVRARLKTNLIILTTARVYHVQLASVVSGGMTILAWQPIAAPVMSRVQKTSMTPPVAKSRHYRITTNERTLQPMTVIDNGRQVFIHMPLTFATASAPPLFIIQPDQSAQLVNYRLAGRTYIVDRLFDHAELRIGLRPQQRVRIDALPEGHPQ
jgi:type IV secretion system protein TrbG